MFDVALLRGLVTTHEKQIDHFRAPREIGTITRPHVDAHFGDAFTYGFAVTKIAVLGFQAVVPYVVMSVILLALVFFVPAVATWPALIG